MYEKMYENSPDSAAISKAIDREVARRIMSTVAHCFGQVTSNQSEPTADELNTNIKNNREP